MSERSLSPKHPPLEISDADLPIDPYILGCWLGDGISKEGALTMHQNDAHHFANVLAATGYTISDISSSQGRERNTVVLTALRPDVNKCLHGHDNSYRVERVSRTSKSGLVTMCSLCTTNEPGKPRTNQSLLNQLTTSGLTRNKHIPEIYLRASREQRLALLQGLMDTDGYWKKTNKAAVFTNTNRNLIDGVYELVVSLGGKATVQRVSTNKQQYRTAWRVYFTPHYFNPFRLARKGIEVMSHTRRSGSHVIRDVKPVPSVPTQHIEVDSPDGLYLAGRQMIPTL